MRPWPLLLLTACDPTSVEGLFTHEAWAPVSEADDPVADHRPADVDCEHGWQAEGSTLEVDTAICAYLALGQPLTAKLPRGTRLTGGVSHDTLIADGLEEGHFGLWLGGERLWEVFVDIPGPADFHAFDVTLEQPVEAGAELVYHLHNHGVNSYRLLPITTQ